MTEEIKTEWLPFPESETKKLEKNALKAMFSIMSSIREDSDQPEAIKRILLALNAAKKMEKDAEDAFSLANPNIATGSCFLDTVSIAATCIFAICNNENVDEIPPCSAGGDIIMAFVAVNKILDAAGNLEFILDNDGSSVFSGLDIVNKIIE